MEKEYFTPITELDSESECEEIIKGFNEILKRINDTSEKLERERQGVDEEDYYQGEFLEMEIELSELRQELANIAQLIIDKNCENMLPPEMARDISLIAQEKLF